MNSGLKLICKKVGRNLDGIDQKKKLLIALGLWINCWNLLSIFVRHLHLYKMKQQPTIVYLILLLSFAACQQKAWLVQSHTQQQYAVESMPNADTNDEVQQLLQPYKAGVDTERLIVIGHADIPLTKAQPECNLGNFMADAQLRAARRMDPSTKASVLNYGGIRSAYIAPGAITRGTLYELMPFDNMVTILEVPGKIVLQWCDYMASKRGWPVSGISYLIKNKKADSVLLNGQPVNPHLYYKIATNDYLAKGGDNCDFLRDLKRQYTSVFLRDALMDYVLQLTKDNRLLHPEIENRVRYAD